MSSNKSERFVYIGVNTFKLKIIIEILNYFKIFSFQITIILHGRALQLQSDKSFQC